MDTHQVKESQRFHHTIVAHHFIMLAIKFLLEALIGRLQIKCRILPLVITEEASFNNKLE